MSNQTYNIKSIVLQELWMFTIILQSQFGSVKKSATKNKKLTRVKAAI